MFCVCAPSSYHFASFGTKPARDDDSRFWRCAAFLFLLAAFPAAVGFMIRLGFFAMVMSGIAYSVESLISVSYKRIKQCCPCRRSCKPQANKAAQTDKPQPAEAAATVGKPQPELVTLSHEQFAQIYAHCEAMRQRCSRETRQYRTERPATARPHVELWASEDNYYINVDTPGVAQAEINVIAQAGSARAGLQPRVSVEGKVHVKVPLPHDADAERATVTYANGQLSLVVPRVKRSIPVKLSVTDATATATCASTRPPATVQSDAAAPGVFSPSLSRAALPVRAPPSSPVLRACAANAANVQQPTEEEHDDERDGAYPEEAYDSHGDDDDDYDEQQPEPEPEPATEELAAAGTAPQSEDDWEAVAPVVSAK